MKTVKAYKGYTDYIQWKTFYKELRHYLYCGYKINKIRATSRSYTIYLK